MNKLTKFFHELLNPHCPDCLVESEVAISNAQCKNCEVLHQQLLIANNEKRDLLNRLIAPPVTELYKESEPEEPTTSASKGLSWKVRKQLLESEKREEAKLIARNKIQTVDELEKELKLNSVKVEE